MESPLRRQDVALCFAVKEECIFARDLASTLILTGMGSRNASRAVKRILAGTAPSYLLTCGFAGGLDPQLKKGDVLFEAHQHPRLTSLLQEAGARTARFYMAPHIAITKEEKQRLREQTGADAVDMESETIHELCRDQRIPCATVRVISDEANEDLPVDFNRFLDSNQNLRLSKLIWSLLGSPTMLPALLKLRSDSRMAARRLAEVLHRLIRE